MESAVDNQIQPQASRPSGEKFVIYVDEVGRGALAFDVVAAAVIFPENATFTDWTGVKDSKKIKSHKKRCELAEFIKMNCVSYGIGTVGPGEIDDINILKATMKAMHMAIGNAIEGHGDDGAKYRLMIDGNYFKPPYPGVEHECIIKGDDKVVGISAASILAKTHRDCEVLRSVQEDDRLGEYGFDTNMAYGTACHFNAIRTLGPTEHHRLSFLKKL